MLIDWARVSELKSEIGEEDFGEVIEIFLDEVEEELSQLTNHTNFATLEAPLHFLKGSALNLGFAEFSKYCQAGETAAAKGENSPIDLAEIQAIYDRSKAEFLAALSADTAA